MLGMRIIVKQIANPVFLAALVSFCFYISSFSSFGLAPHAAGLLLGAIASLTSLLTIVLSEKRERPLWLFLAPLVLCAYAAWLLIDGAEWYQVVGFSAEPGSLLSLFVLYIVFLAIYEVRMTTDVLPQLLIRGFGLASLVIALIDGVAAYSLGESIFAGTLGVSFWYLLGLACVLMAVLVVAERKVLDTVVMLGLLCLVTFSSAVNLFAVAFICLLCTVAPLLHGLKERGQVTPVLLAVFVAALFAIGISFFGSFKEYRFLPAGVDVRPSFTFSLEAIAKATSVKPSFFWQGGGWNTFEYAWNMFRPHEANFLPAPGKVVYPYNLWLMMLIVLGIFPVLLGLAAIGIAAINAIGYMAHYNSAQRNQLLSVFVPAAALAYVGFVAAIDIPHVYFLCAALGAVATIVMPVPSSSGLISGIARKVLVVVLCGVTLLGLAFFSLRYTVLAQAASIAAQADATSYDSVRDASYFLWKMHSFDPLPELALLSAEAKEIGIELLAAEESEDEEIRARVETDFTDAIYYAITSRLDDRYDIDGVMLYGDLVAQQYQVAKGEVDLIDVYSSLHQRAAMDPVAYYRAAKNFFTVGDIANAKEFVVRALRLNPGFPEAKQLLGKIEQREYMSLSQ